MTIKLISVEGIIVHLKANPQDALKLFEAVDVVCPWSDCLDCAEGCTEDEEDPCPSPCPNETIGSSERYSGESEMCRIKKLNDCQWQWIVQHDRGTERMEGKATALSEAKAECDKILRKNPRLILVD